jgi:predicted MFS family arabinose efflux permease
MYTLTHGLAYGIGPVMGGLLSDNIGPSFIWIGGGVVGLISVLVFISMSKRSISAA